MRKILLAGLFASMPLFPAAAADPVKELNFGIISTETSQNLKAAWDPLLAEMQKATGLKVNAFFATDYAGIIQAMRFDKVQIAWYGNKSAMEAVDRAEGEVFAQVMDKDGNPGYWSLIIVNKDSPIQTLDDLLKNAKNYTFGNGDPNSTSGFLVPSYYVFAKNNVDAKTAFKRVVSANHETNALAVANKQVDAATNNTEAQERLLKTAPEKAKEIRVIWKSPLIPNDPLVWRKDLPADIKEKVRAFFVSYGHKGSADEIAHARETLAALNYAGFKESSNAQLNPIRQLELFRDRTRIENDTAILADDKKAKLAEIDAKLAELQHQSGS